MSEVNIPRPEAAESEATFEGHHERVLQVMRKAPWQADTVEAVRNWEITADEPPRWMKDVLREFCPHSVYCEPARREMVVVQPDGTEALYVDVEVNASRYSLYQIQDISHPDASKAEPLGAGSMGDLNEAVLGFAKDQLVYGHNTYPPEHNQVPTVGIKETEELSRPESSAFGTVAWCRSLASARRRQEQKSFHKTLERVFKIETVDVEPWDLPESEGSNNV